MRLTILNFLADDVAKADENGAGDALSPEGLGLEQVHVLVEEERHGS